MDIQQRRREDILQQIPEGIAIIPTAPHKTRNSDVHYPFRPDSDFFYLTRFPEPDAIAVLINDGEHCEYILFCRSKDPKREIWDGKRIGEQAAQSDYGADIAYSIDDFWKKLPTLLTRAEQVYTIMGRYPEFDAKILKSMSALRNNRAGNNSPHEFLDLRHLLHEMRLFKHKKEVSILKKAAKISVNAHHHAMRTTKPGMYEYQVQAELEYIFQKSGSPSPAYPSIVAGGSNACVLHYIDNNTELKDGDLLLIDAGCELEGYASDITRTFPVNGKFSATQKALYEVVLAAQLAAIDAVTVNRSVMDYHDVAVEVLTQGLIDLGIISTSLEQALEQRLYEPYYMHKTGHWLGMDVHDVGDYKINGQWRVLEPGMVLTVEPGLYISPSDKVDDRFHGIGIRIEDDVLVSKEGPQVLTRAAVKSVDDIEQLMA